MLLAKTEAIVLGSVTSLLGVFTSYLLVTFLIRVLGRMRSPAHMEQAKDCFLWFQPKAITCCTTQFIFVFKNTPSDGGMGCCLTSPTNGVLQHRHGNWVSGSKILWVTRGTNPAEWPKSQGKYVPGKRTCFINRWLKFFLYLSWLLAVLFFH